MENLNKIYTRLKNNNPKASEDLIRRKALIIRDSQFLTGGGREKSFNSYVGNGYVDDYFE